MYVVPQSTQVSSLTVFTGRPVGSYHFLSDQTKPNRTIPALVTAPSLCSLPGWRNHVIRVTKTLIQALPAFWVQFPWVPWEECRDL